MPTSETPSIAEKLRQRIAARLQKRIEQMQAREKDKPHRVMTVRMPISLHEAIKRAAHAAGVSVNAFCVEVLEMTTEETPNTGQ